MSMSIWTQVRAVYDLSSGWFPHESEFNGKLISCSDRVESAIASIRYDSIFSLGSERQIEYHIYPFHGELIMSDGLNMSIDDRVTFVMFGNLRDCERDTFVKALNVFLGRLPLYGVHIDSALVRII